MSIGSFFEMFLSLFRNVGSEAFCDFLRETDVFYQCEVCCTGGFCVKYFNSEVFHTKKDTFVV